MYHPKRREYEQKVKDGVPVIPVYAEVLLDTESPITVFVKLCRDNQGYLLESVGGGEQVGRYSFIGCDPFVHIEATDGLIRVARRCNHTMRVEPQAHTDPFEVLRELLSHYHIPGIPELPRFFGGLVGYLSYDMARYIEHLPRPPERSLDLPELALMGCRKIVVFDHVTRRGTIIVNHVLEDGGFPTYKDAIAEVEQVMGALNHRADELLLPTSTDNVCAPSKPVFNVSQQGFISSVKRAKRYIAQGDAFQVVLSQRAEAPLTVSPLSLYRTLRAINPSPYMFYINFGDMQLVGSSPEMLVRMEDGIVESKPLAGTRKRGLTPDEDESLEKQLLGDAKERAEHVMLVDLSRNDLGRVCQYGSIEVPNFMKVEHFSHVMHIVSEVKGVIEPGLDAVDVFRACFPAGTLSGAPKVRAMEIIDELETCKRGPYGGAVGYFGFSGNMDTCITIRTAVIQKQKVYVQAGAGVVFDSDPEREYQECLDKARALFIALEQVKEVENGAQSASNRQL